MFYLIDCHHGHGIRHLLGSLCCTESGWGVRICKLLCYSIALHRNLSLFLSSQNVPVALSVFPLQFAKLSVLANPVIYVVMNKAVSLYLCITVH